MTENAKGHDHTPARWSFEPTDTVFPRPDSAMKAQVIVVEPVDRRGHFAARLNGRVLVKSSSTPFCDAARVLVSEGADPSTTLVMRHAGSEVDALRARLGIAAGLTVKERDSARPTFERWEPLSRSPVGSRTPAEPEPVPNSTKTETPVGAWTAGEGEAGHSLLQAAE